MAGYGIDTSDEGYIVYPAAQVAAGLAPYRDIDSLYTPLAWYLHAALFKIVGVGLVPLRVFFSAVVAALAVGVYALARQHVSPWLAAVPVVAFALVFPIPQVWAPYPAWYALGGLLVALLAMGRWLVDRRDRWLALAGVGCAFAFGTKPSVGLFGLLAFCAYLALQARYLDRVPLPGGEGPGGGSSKLPALTPDGLGDPSPGLRPVPPPAAAPLPSGEASHPLSPGERAGVRGTSSAGQGLAPSWALPLLQAVLVLLAAAAFWVLIRPVATPGNVLLLVGSMLLAGLALVEPAAPADLAHLAVQATRRCLWLIGAFLLATLPWYVALSIAAGWDLTFQSIFVNGARTAAAFDEPIVLPNRDAVEAMVWIAAGAALALGAARLGPRRLARWWPPAVGLVLVALVAVIVWRARATGVGPLDYAASNVLNRLSRTASEETDLLMYLPFVGLWLAIGLVAWRRRVSDLRTRRLGLLVWFTALFAFQLYPHASYRHMLFTIAPFLVVIAALRGEAWRWIAPRLHSPTWRTLAMAGLLVFPAIMLPTAWRARADVLSETAFVDLPHADVRASADEQARLAFVATRIADLPPGAPIFAYPAEPMVYLLTDHPNPTRESYLPAGYLDEARQRDVVARLETTRTRYVVWSQELVARWGLAAADRIVGDYLWTAYRPIAAERGWVLLERAGP